MAVTKRIRFEVLRRDEFTCRYCRSRDNALTVDHVVPVALGGSDDPSNLVAACKDCNAGKASASPDEAMVAQVEADALRWASAMEVVVGRRRAARRAVDEYSAAAAGAWLDEFDGLYRAPELPADAEQSFEAFYARGLPIEELSHAIRVAARNKNVGTWEKWRYFCGVAWKKLTAIQDEARYLAAIEGETDGGE